MADDFAALKDIYEKNLKKIISKHELNEKKVLSEFGKSLANLESKVRSSGDLEGLIIVRKEKERFSKERTLPEPTEGNVNPKIVELVEKAKELKASYEEDKNKKILNLTNLYIERLEKIKADFTRGNKIEEALAVKQEQDKVKKRPEVTAAKFSIAVNEVEEKKDNVEDEKKVASSDIPTGHLPGVPNPLHPTMVCPGCQGTGKIPEPCPICKGTGHCSKCQGKGKVPSRMKGSHNLSSCFTCRGSGECTTCKGSKTTSKTISCTRCVGTGKVASGYSSTSSYYSPDYTTMNLYSKIESLTAKPMIIREAMRDYFANVGNIYETEGTIRYQIGSRYAYVMESIPGQTYSSSSSLIPVNAAVSQELLNFSDSSGNPVKVKIKYTIQRNGRRFILGVSK